MHAATPTSAQVIAALNLRAKELGIDDVTGEAFARALDAADELAPLREQFHIPTVAQVTAPVDKTTVVVDVDKSSGVGLAAHDDCVYLCGNSLGLQPRAAKQMLLEELDVWARRGVHGHVEHDHGRGWVSVDDLAVASSARIVGARPEEVAIMNSLTVNLHFLMVAFYRPTSTRFKILIEEKAFPSDQYAVESQLKLHGLSPADALVTVRPRPGEQTLRTEDIVATIEREGDTLALVLFSGVQYYTGQFFDIQAIAGAGHRVGATVGIDLAHAVGNVELQLHDWNVDFAAWCSYKYLNAGPGGISGIFVHERHFGDASLKRLTGWWSNKLETRFQMRPELDAISNAQGFRVSNPCVLAVVSLLASLQVFDRTTIPALTHKSRQLTGYLAHLLNTRILAANPDLFHIITPQEPRDRGCQLSLIFRQGVVTKVFRALTHMGVVCDKREPDCIRVAPVPLYNSFRDVWWFVELLREAIVEMV